MDKLNKYLISYTKKAFVRTDEKNKITLELLPEYGKGKTQLMGDFTSCYISFSDIEFHKPFITEERFPEKTLEFGQFLQGDVFFYKKKKEPLYVNPGLNFLVNYPNLSGYRHFAPHQRFICYGVFFREHFFDTLPFELPEDFWETAAAVLNPGVLQIPAITRICEELITCQLKEPEIYYYIQSKIQEAFVLVLDYIYAHRPQQNIRLTAEDRRLIEDVKLLIQQNLQQPLSIQEIARTIGMSQQKLMKAFKQLNQTTIYGYLKVCRMEKAANLLGADSLSISQIANAVGYAGDGHFQQAFRSVFGINPGQFRKEILSTV